METIELESKTTTGYISEYIDGNLVKATFVQVTPEIAEQMLSKNTANRPISPVNTKFIMSELEKGNWKFNGDPIIFDTDGVLINGQHRLMSIMETGISLVLLVIYGVQSDAFKVMDTGKKRSGSDALSIEGIDNFVTTASVLKFIYGVKNGKYSASRRSTRTLSNTDLIDYYYTLPNVNESVIVGKEGSKSFQSVLSATIVGGFHYLFSEIDGDNADDFITQLTTGIALTVDSPITALRNRLIKSKTQGDKLTNKEVIAYIILAWNKFRKGEKAERLKMPANFDFEMV